MHSQEHVCISLLLPMIIITQVYASTPAAMPAATHVPTTTHAPAATQQPAATQSPPAAAHPSGGHTSGGTHQAGSKKADSGSCGMNDAMSFATIFIVNIISVIMI